MGAVEMMKDTDGPFYVIVTPSYGLQVVDHKNFCANAHVPNEEAFYYGTRLEGSFSTIKEAEALVNEITLSVLRSELSQLDRVPVSNPWRVRR